MRIHGLLSWYDEPVAWLAAAVSSFGRFCDTIVAVDGAYSLYPQGTPRSHPNQVEAIQLAAEAAQVSCLVYQPSETWAENEIGKRQFAIDLLLAIADWGDWVCVFDADYHVRRVNVEAVRWDLENTDLNVATYELLDTIEEPKTSWTSPTRDFFRWEPALRIGPTHAHYSLSDKWLKGPGVELEEALSLGQNLVCYHRTQDRTRARIDAQQRYYKTRQMLNIEEAVSG